MTFRDSNELPIGASVEIYGTTNEPHIIVAASPATHGTWYEAVNTVFGNRMGSYREGFKAILSMPAGDA